MYLVTNHLTQPQSIGEETLPSGGQIAVESVNKRTRGLELRGFLSINKIEEDAFDGEKQNTANPDDGKPKSSSQPKTKEQK